MHALVLYIKPNTWPGKLQSSLLGYFPGYYETATGDTDAPSRHFPLSLQLLPLSPHLASAPVVFINSQLHHLHVYEQAHILHWDISVGNIILMNKGGGLLIEWELAKMVDDDKSR